MTLSDLNDNRNPRFFLPLSGTPNIKFNHCTILSLDREDTANASPILWHVVRTEQGRYPKLALTVTETVTLLNKRNKRAQKRRGKGKLQIKQHLEEYMHGKINSGRPKR